VSSPLFATIWMMALLAIVMATKHYIADFLFQTKWIAHGKECARGWFMPLLTHVLGHAALTLAIALVVAPRLWWLALADFAIHFVIDRGKGLLCRSAHLGPDDKTFWLLLGFDQYLHQITNILIAAALMLA
jgi:hypothetical protein